MRVALDATYSVDAQPSGIALYSRHLLAGLAALYPDEEFLCCYRPKQFLKANRFPPPFPKRLLLSGWRTFRAEVFHALNQRVDRRPARRVISTFHDLFVLTAEYSSPQFRERMAAQARGAAQRSDLVIAVSRFTADQVTALLGVEPSRVRVIHHGVEQPPANGDERRRKIVLFIGALQRRKNLIRLVEAFESMPPEWRLVLAGSANGFEARAILDRIEQSSCRERIRVSGYASAGQLQGLLSSASLFAFPSLDEGFGLPVLEAMAWGVPVITSKSSALPEVAGQAAVLVDPRNTGEIAAALNRLAQEPALRRDLIERGKLRSREFSWERAARETFALYRELAGN